MQISIDKQTQRIIDSIHALPEQVNQATVLSLNRTAEWMKGRISKEISANQRLKLKLIRDRIKIARANKRVLISLLNCNFYGVKAIDLGTPRQTPLGTVVGNRLFRHAFIAKIKKGGQEGVYRRVGTKRFPLKSARVEIYDDAVNIIEKLLGEEAGTIFEARFKHELQRITGAMI